MFAMNNKNKIIMFPNVLQKFDKTGDLTSNLLVNYLPKAVNTFENRYNITDVYITNSTDLT